jgi:hypothetical protein
VSHISPSAGAQVPEEQLYPAFAEFVRATRLLEKLKGGDTPVRVMRILGQGKTRAEGLKLEYPPAPIERSMELAKLDLSKIAALKGTQVPSTVTAEIQSAKALIDAEVRRLKAPDGWERMARQCLALLPQPNGLKDGHFFAGRCLLQFDRKAASWSWTFTQHYALVSKIPSDVDYIVRAFESAKAALQDLILPPEQFMDKLELAWKMASHLSKSDQVLLREVARLFLVAGQPESFWKDLRRQNFQDLPNGLFAASMASAKRELMERFVLEPATLNQSHGAAAVAYFLPKNEEGTQTLPYSYIRPLKRE